MKAKASGICQLMMLKCWTICCWSTEISLDIECLETFIAIWHFYCIFLNIGPWQIEVFSLVTVSCLDTLPAIPSANLLHQEDVIRVVGVWNEKAGSKNVLYLYMHIMNVGDIDPTSQWSHLRGEIQRGSVFHFLLYELVYFGFCNI